MVVDTALLQISWWSVTNAHMRGVFLLLLAALASRSCTALDSLVPVGFQLGGDGGATFMLVKMDMLVRNSDPNLYPMFNDLPHVGPQRSVSAAELEAHLDATSAASGFGLLDEPDGTDTREFPYSNPTPQGFIFHEARVGSTLGANSTCHTCAVTVMCGTSLLLL
jgi:hypothetical protein